VKEREVEHPEDAENDRVALISGHHGNERQQSSAETHEVHAGLSVEADRRQQAQQRRLTHQQVVERPRL